MTAIWKRRVRRLHRWLGLLVGAQLLLWVLGGLVMSSFPIETVRGQHLAREVSPQRLPDDLEVLDPARILSRFPGATQLRLKLWRERPVYQVMGEQTQLLDAQSGAVLSPLSEELAVQVAREDYAGDGKIGGVDWLDQPALEYRGRDLPLWRVRFDDDLDTAIYVSPATGEVVARRNDIWRLFDFVWMLHIMDYNERDDFNHPLPIAFAASALAFVLSGGLMLWLSLRPAR